MSTLEDHPARTRIEEALGDTLFVEAGAGSGKTTALISRLRRLVDEGVELRCVAAITFTEKAAQELRDRLRAALTADLDGQAPKIAARRRVALSQLDSAAVGTLHSFAQRLLTHLPIEAGLPPRVEVLDEVSSVVAFEERWQQFLQRMLDDPGLTRTIHLALALNVRPDRFRDLASAFDDSWDLLGDDRRAPWSTDEPPAVDLAEVEAAWQAIEDLIPGCRNEACKLLAAVEAKFRPWMAWLRQEQDEGVVLSALQKPPTKGGGGRKGDWPDVVAVKQAVEDLREAAMRSAARVTQHLVERVAATVRTFTLEAAEARQADGQLEFHDLLVLARQLLRGPHGDDARRLLHGHYERILLDEFQDTDPIQIDIAVLLTANPDVPAPSWQAGRPLAGRLFVVGDPKQSIYRFRRADISLFLEARGSLSDAPLQLTTNFRSTPTILGWVNDTFGRLITHEEGSQPDYVPLAADRDDLPDGPGPGVGLLGGAAHDDKPSAADIRAREAADVAATISRALTDRWLVKDGDQGTHPARLGDITILLPARTSLPALEDALIEANIPYRAESASLVYATSEIRALMAALRAISDPTDAHATVTALRSVLFGCGDDDLADWAVTHCGSWNLRAALPEDVPDDHPVAESMAYLNRLHRRARWTSPPDLLAQLVEDRRLLETGFAARRPRDVWRRVRFVVDQARSWADSQHGGLRQYLSWAALQASDHARVAESVLPETDDDSVRIMTIHAAKGMQFPIVIASGMSSQPQSSRGAVQVLWGEPIQVKLGKDIQTEDWESMKALDEVMGFHERIRLLYVAMTRAEDHLVVSLHRAKDRGFTPTSSAAELLAWGCAASAHGEVLRPDLAPLPSRTEASGVELLDAEAWASAHAAAMAQSRWRRTLSATDGADLVSDESDEELAAGAEKAKPDIDLPPWLKGRYGSAVGRAVHGVLQVVDLKTGAGLGEAAAAQCAAESIPERAETVKALAQMALDSDLVHEAARAPHWRETYVAVPTDDGRVLEGYVDLLFERGDDLVVVDYKVAAGDADLDRRTVHYTPQATAYAQAIGASTGRRVSAVQLLFLTPAGAVARAVATG
jgi:ATP-dependent helicase/nuclease subunit A